VNKLYAKPVSADSETIEEQYVGMRDLPWISGHGRIVHVVKFVVGTVVRKSWWVSKVAKSIAHLSRWCQLTTQSRAQASTASCALATAARK
jgi:hypothetical protein